MSAVLMINNTSPESRSIGDAWCPQSGMFRYVLEEISERIKDKSPQLAHSIWESGHYNTYASFAELSASDFQLILEAVNQMFFDSFTNDESGDDLHNIGMLRGTMILDPRSNYQPSTTSITINDNLQWTGERWIQEFLIGYLTGGIKSLHPDIYVRIGSSWVEKGFTDWSDLQTDVFSTLYVEMKRLHWAYATPRRTLSGSDWFLLLISYATKDLYPLFMADPRAIALKDNEASLPLPHWLKSE